MKNKLFISLVACLVVSFELSAQDITTNQQKFPFDDYMEWPEHGAILFAKDPAKSIQQQELSFIDETGTLKWQEHYLPQVETPYIIASRESDFLYFLDQIRPVEGKISYNQVSLSGYIKKGSIYFPPIFKTLENVDYESSKLIDIINSGGDLIFHFREEDKKNKLYKDVLIFFNHALLKVFPVVVTGAFLTSELDNHTKSLVQYAGSTGEENYFSYSVSKAKQKGYDILVYSKKGELTATRFYTGPKETIRPIEVKSNQLSGAYYLKEDVNPVIGQIYFYKDAFYLVGANDKDGISIWKYTKDQSQLIVENIAVTHKKSTDYGVGLSFLDDKIIVFSTSDMGAQNKVFATDGKEQIAGKAKENYERNPSQLLYGMNALNFVVKLNDAIYEIANANWKPTNESVVLKKR